MSPSDGPTYIGLSGLAGSGKTTVANLLTPPVRYFVPTEESLKSPSPIFSHYFLATPLYEMVGLLRLTEGDNRHSRICYGLYDILSDLLEKRLPFEEMIAFVEDVAAWDAGTEYDAKPRSMMQQVGDACRDVYLDCFANMIIRKANFDYAAVKADIEAELPSDYDDEVNYPDFYAIVSDVRYPNEVEALRRAGRLIMVKLDVSFDTANQRIIDRDGVGMTAEQWSHPTEAGFPDEVFDLIIDTEELNKKEVATQVRNFVLNLDRELEVSTNG